MVLRSYALCSSLVCATALYGGCGDDSGDGNGSEQRDAATSGDAAATGTDGGSRPDAGTSVDSGSRVVDSGTRDSAVSNLDSGQTNRDSGVADTGAADTGTDSGGGGASASAACVQCEATQCKLTDVEQLPPDAVAAFDDISKLCDSFGDATAAGGDQAGVAKAKLCKDYLACARRTRCADGIYGKNPDDARERESISCYCGTLSYDECQKKKASELEGPCAIEAASAYETNEAKTIGERTLNPVFAGGMATWTLRCDLHVCADECYAPCSNKPDGGVCGNAICNPSGGTCLPGTEPQVCTAGSCSNYSQGDDPNYYTWMDVPGAAAP